MKLYVYDSYYRDRIWEIDLLRGIALILMVLFHFMFDLSFFFSIQLDTNQGMPALIGKTAAILFIMLSGVSCQFNRHPVKRGMQILGWALLISLITCTLDFLLPIIGYSEVPDLCIKFGILHFLGVCAIISPQLTKMKTSTLLLFGFAAMIAGMIFSRISMPFDYLFPLGLISAEFQSLDYYALFPWLGLYILGIVVGRSLYKEKLSFFNSLYSDNIVCKAGRNTLLVYMIHQPILLIGLEIINLM